MRCSITRGLFGPKTATPTVGCLVPVSSVVEPATHMHENTTFMDYTSFKRMFFCVYDTFFSVPLAASVRHAAKHALAGL